MRGAVASRWRLLLASSSVSAQTRYSKRGCMLRHRLCSLLCFRNSHDAASLAPEHTGERSSARAGDARTFAPEYCNSYTVRQKHALCVASPSIKPRRAASLGFRIASTNKMNRNCRDPSSFCRGARPPLGSAAAAQASCQRSSAVISKTESYVNCTNRRAPPP